MRKLTIFQSLSFLLSCTASRIGMFDFNNRNASRCVRKGSYHDPVSWNWKAARNDSVTDLAAAILKEDKEIIPERVTICNTIYADIDDCDTIYNYLDNHETIYTNIRMYPTWAFVDQSGKVNLSLNVETNKWRREKLTFQMGAADQTFTIGMLRLSIQTPHKPNPTF